MKPLFVEWEELRDEMVAAGWDDVAVVGPPPPVRRQLTVRGSFRGVERSFSVSFVNDSELRPVLKALRHAIKEAK